jgi:hypothetical protein
MKIRVIRRRQPRGATSPARSIDRPHEPPRAITPRVSERVTRLVVDVGNRASAWRGAAFDAELAYRRWKTAPQAERGDAAAAYLAAIEREETAAAVYSQALEACRNTVA